jgi:hypothetical protein
MRKLAGLVLAVWTLSSGAALVHFSAPSCCGHEHQHEQEQEPERDPDPRETPCSICLAIEHVPVIALAQQVTDEAREDVGAWISPWIALVPDDVFFDRPLARGPPHPS